MLWRDVAGNAKKKIISFILRQKKVKLSVYRPWRPLGLCEVEAPTFSDILLIDGGKVASPTHRPALCLSIP
jgi:hypothetical protein